jgi:hypothetical protein
LGDTFNGCCWPRFQIRFHHPISPTPCARRFVTSTHLAPSCCEPGRVSHQAIFDLRFAIANFRSRSESSSESVNHGNQNLKSNIENYKDPSNFRRSADRPRASRDFTVPTLIPSVAATSS